MKFVRDDEGNDNESALLKQIQTCNEIISLLSEKLGEEELNILHIEEEGEVLTANVFRENGVEVHEMTQEESKKWSEASQPVVDEFAEISDTAKQLINAAKKLHK